MSHETSPGIITASDDGKAQIYFNHPLGGKGFVDLSNAAQSKTDGFVKLDGEPPQ